MTALTTSDFIYESLSGVQCPLQVSRQVLYMHGVAGDDLSSQLVKIHNGQAKISPAMACETCKGEVTSSYAHTTVM